MSDENKNEHGDHGDQDDKKLVSIKINNEAISVRRGKHTVGELKASAKPPVPPADELDEVISGELKPLPDDGEVNVKGGEVFFSQPKKGSGS